MARSIYEMGLHEIVNTEFYSITRVAGGWIYSCIAHKTSVFVPWNNEFQQADAPYILARQTDIVENQDCTQQTNSDAGTK